MMEPSKERIPRSGSIASNHNKRPRSRASTTSAQSAGHPPVPEHHIGGQDIVHKQWYNNGTAHQRFGSINNQMSPEDMVMHSASQLQNPQHYDIDPSLGAEQHHGLPYPPEPQYKLESGGPPGSNEHYGGSYVDGDSNLLEGRSEEQDEVESAAGPAKKASKSSAANELEMRQLFQSNKHRSLPEVAMELHGNERGPQSERQRQVFAMLWINQVCDKGKGSVPRGRVYANYVSRCATERVTVLNPASFGKLVRVLFPGLKTRRLGVRGESKYHYVNFSLKDDQPELAVTQTSQPVQSFVDASEFATSFSQNAVSNPQYTNDRAAFPSPDIVQMPDTTLQRTEGFVKPHSLYHQPDIRSIQELDTSSNKITQRLRFPNPAEVMTQEYEPISLPSIEPFVPAGTDPDAATALTALYRSHCTSLIECIRFCKEKTFFHLFQSFHGTLTMPVQKLFANPGIAAWIEECDFAMYQKMMRVVAPLTLQVAPKPVLDTLRSISERLVAHIQTSFQGQPNHVIEAKKAPAALFAGLLDRELRVNLTAHAAANMLSNPANRDQMYEDWITMVRTRKIAECVPTRGMDDVVNLLITELRDLLDPVGVPWDVEGLTPYGEMALRTGRQQQTRIHADSSTENVLDRWVNFLVSLPGKFPYATHAEIVWCVQSVSTAVMRDLTIAQGKSFGAWWVTKCWIDEMISFMAEQGGFMEYKSSYLNRRGSTKHSMKDRISERHGSRYSSGSDDFLRGNGQIEGSVSVSMPMDITSQAAINSAAGHDDSGIGMQTPDDDFVMTKYNFVRGDSHPHMGANNMSHQAVHGPPEI
ncbi:RFX DNA-binding domain-containing protein [Bisporella sp. PMI_857]|nr:RFX DNA-binding domain-containing protein [Bisporella sp. PMI_857]